MERLTLVTKPSDGYELLDSGGEEKLERFGDVVLRRPDPQALWPKKLGESEWNKATGTYVREGGEGGKWVGKLPTEWKISFGGLQFLVKPTSFKHTGLFPEQESNWVWTAEQISKVGREVSVLNLFGYTGGATLAAAKAGAQVTHVDASKTAVAWARENAQASGLEEAPIRWITEDVLLFVRREIARGKKYDGIIMDPPAFGHGPKNEIWKIEENLIELIDLCGQLLSDQPLFFLVNGYAAGYSPLAFAYNLEQFEKKYGGALEYGDLGIEEQGSGRILPAGIFARWKK
ncbi:MAG: class I SAM-dependent methyltransferase [Candidatus Adlerbacteria bacterium]|nr:class I SAM-dependent methyltransferase [Candidatus Adlerbacteria bacterium]